MKPVVSLLTEAHRIPFLTNMLVHSVDLSLFLCVIHAPLISLFFVIIIISVFVLQSFVPRDVLPDMHTFNLVLL